MGVAELLLQIPNLSPLAEYGLVGICLALIILLWALAKLFTAAMVRHTEAITKLTVAIETYFRRQD